MARKSKKKAPKVVSYRVKLTRIKSNNNNLRTTTIKGVTTRLPRVGGEGFVLIAESLSDPGNGFRLVTTSSVVEVSGPVEGLIDFDTLNSSYVLELLPDEEEE